MKDEVLKVEKKDYSGFFYFKWFLWLEFRDCNSILLQPFVSLNHISVKFLQNSF